jgi:hypothetical protein
VHPGEHRWVIHHAHIISCLIAQIAQEQALGGAGQKWRGVVDVHEVDVVRCDGPRLHHAGNHGVVALLRAGYGLVAVEIPVEAIAVAALECIRSRYGALC